MRRFLFYFLLPMVFLCSCNSKKSSKTYEIGIDPTWFPLQLGTQEKNVYAFSIELIAKIAEKQGLEIAAQKMNWNNLLWGLKEKKYPAIFSSLRPYSFYEKQFSFSDLFLLTGPVFVVLKDVTIKNPQDLKGKEIAVIRGSSASLLLQTMPGILLQGYDSIPLALEALEKKHVDAAAIEILLAQNYVRDLYQKTMKILGPPLSNEGLRLITLYEKAPELLKQFNKGLIALKKSGEYEKLLTKWGLSPDGQLGMELSD